MEQRRQATLLNYALALEDSVILDKIWLQLQDVFSENEKREILNAGGNKRKMRVMLEILPQKDDSAFHVLVAALKPDYRWLSFRIEQGVHEEEDRLTRAGKGVKRKVTVALMSTRISDRQRDMVIDTVSDVIEEELRDRTLRVDIPDHKAASNLNELNMRLRQLINKKVDPLLHGPMMKTDLSEMENQVLADRLEQMLEEMRALEDCYKTMEIDKLSATPRSLPSLLYQKIEEVKTRIGILEDDQEQYRLERDEILRERNEKGQSISELESSNTNLEFENRKLREEVITLETSVQELNKDKRNLTNERRRFEDEQIRIANIADKLEDESMFIQTRNKRLEEINAKLTKDVQRLTASNIKLRGETRRSSIGESARLKSDKKRLMDERSRLQTEIRRQENEKRQVLVRNQRLEAENQNLKEQKKRLYEEKNRFLMENQNLRTDAKRMAIGSFEKYPKSREYRSGAVNYTKRSKSVEVEAYDAPRNSRGARRGSVRSTSVTTNSRTKPQTSTPSGNRRINATSTARPVQSDRMFRSYGETSNATVKPISGQKSIKEPSPPKGSKPSNNNNNPRRKSVTFRG
ncbi:immunoglobulin G-binding protein H [Patella vulgata]|uniref:immunoglobulin G-binding protein H n=1 Tax=Patella vulgata TaxID=6465 RepID=UPI00217FE596|nr:immunoglobulin G-binding protein H [Patella vulgata]